MFHPDILSRGGGSFGNVKEGRHQPPGCAVNKSQNPKFILMCSYLLFVDKNTVCIAIDTLLVKSMSTQRCRDGVMMFWCRHPLQRRIQEPKKGGSACKSQHPALLRAQYVTIVTYYRLLEKGGSVEPSEPPWIHHCSCSLSFS